MRSRSTLMLVAAAAALSACTSSGKPSGASASAATGGSAASGGSVGSGGLGSAGAAGTLATGGSSGSAGTAVASGGSGGSPSGGSGGTAGVSSNSGDAGGGVGLTLRGPCDIYAEANTPCVSANSTVRALYGAYKGNLYQVRRASDMTTHDIPVMSPGGFADSAQQDAFCNGTTCTVSIIYDQSPMANHMPVSPPVLHLPNGGKEADAGSAKIMIGSHTVYGILFPADSTDSYRNNATKGVATGDMPEAIYMVADANTYNGRCCFDYGNVETDGKADGPGTMEAINIGIIPNWSVGAGSGPWVMTDLESGVWAGGGPIPNTSPFMIPSNTSLIAKKYATVMMKGGSGNHFALKGGDAQSGALGVKYDGPRPSPGYDPMRKQGALELGVGGDGSGGGTGVFFEGAVTSGSPPDSVDDAVQANIVAFYGQ